MPVQHSQGLPGSSVCHHWWDCGTGRPEGSHWQVPAFGPVGKHITLYWDLHTCVTFLLLDWLVRILQGSAHFWDSREKEQLVSSTDDCSEVTVCR